MRQGTIGTYLFSVMPLPSSRVSDDGAAAGSAWLPIADAVTTPIEALSAMVAASAATFLVKVMGHLSVGPEPASGWTDVPMRRRGLLGFPRPGWCWPPQHPGVMGTGDARSRSQS